MNADSDERASKDFEEDLIDQIRNRLVSDLMVNNFDALLEVVAPDDALRAIRPYVMHSGMAMAANARKRFNLQGNGLEELVMPLYWMHLATSQGQCMVPEIWDGGVVMELRYCPFSRGRPEICIAESHYYAEGICESVNPEYEFVFMHHLANGDTACRCVVREKRGSFSIDQLGELRGHMPEIELTEDEKKYLSDEIAIESLTMFTKAAIDLKVEDRLLEELMAPNHALGRQIGLFLVNEFEGRLEGIDGAERAIELCTTALGIVVKRKASTDEGVELEISTCSFQRAPEQVCEQLEMALNGVCQAIEPDSEVVHHRMSKAGEVACHWTLRKKRAKEQKGKPTKPSISKEGADDPVRLLTTRMVNGEITEEEYDRKMNLILKHYLRP